MALPPCIGAPAPASPGSTRSGTRGGVCVDRRPRVTRARVARHPGLAVYGYHLPHFHFMFLGIQTPGAGRSWLDRIVDGVTTAVRQDGRGPSSCRNVGFTAAGLTALGLAPEQLSSFEPAFREGIESRAEILGDTGASDPRHWEGGLGTPDVHVLLMLFAASLEELEVLVQDQEHITTSTPGIEVLWEQRAASFPEPDQSREHFGFRDGISRVALKGSGTEPFPGQPLVDARGVRARLPR